MRIEKVIVHDVFFDNFGPRRFFSGNISWGQYKQTFPAFAFPLADEEKIKEKFKKMFGDNSFEKGNSFEAYVLEDGMIAWGLINPIGQIFSLQSIYYSDAQLNKHILKHYELLNLDYPGIHNWASREDKINAIPIFYLLENPENEMAEICKRYYHNVLLKNELDDSLASNISNNSKINKI
jgi:hypothetical protein